MRFYGFGNYYLSSLQQGLQAAHTVGEIFVKHNHAILNSVNDYTQPKEIELLEKADMVLDWAQHHKTMVLLNGGNSLSLQELFDFFDNEDNPYPYAKFHEDDQSLNGALTYVGIILPEKIYETSLMMRTARSFFYDDNLKRITFSEGQGIFSIPAICNDFSKFEFELCNKINEYRLAI